MQLSHDPVMKALNLLSGLGIKSEMDNRTLVKVDCQVDSKYHLSQKFYSEFVTSYSVGDIGKMVRLSNSVALEISELARDCVHFSREKPTHSRDTTDQPTVLEIHAASQPAAAVYQNLL